MIKRRGDGTPNFALLLGAGASISSGVKPTKKMIDEWRQQQYRNSKSSEAYDDWLNKQKWYMTPDEYATLFELTFDEPAQRRIYIEDCVKNASPFWGYIYLANIVANNFFNVIFTPNFDDLMNEACFVYADCKPVVCAHDSAVNGIRVTTKRPKIIKLHGDFLYDNIKNTIKETDTLEKNMREKLSAFAMEYGLVVVGYGGNDRSIMDTLEILLRSGGYFPHGIYWCLKKGSKVSGILDRFLSREKVYVVEIDDFGSFMAELHNGLGIMLPMGIMFPYESITSRLNRFILVEDKLTNKIIRRDISRIVMQIKKFEGSLSETLPPHLSPVPYAFLGMRELDVGDINQGIVYIKKAIAQIGEDTHLLFYILGKSYRITNQMDELPPILTKSKKISTSFDEKSRLLNLMKIINPAESLIILDEMEELMTEKNEEEIFHNSRASVFLLLKKYDDALKESALGLSVNPDEPGIKCSRLLALKGLNRVPEAKKYGKEILDSLTDKHEVINFGDYIRAVVYGVLDDKPKMLTYLETCLKNQRFLYAFIVLSEPDFSDFRTDSDFKALMKRMLESK